MSTTGENRGKKQHQAESSQKPCRWFWYRLDSPSTKSTSVSWKAARMIATNVLEVQDSTIIPVTEKAAYLNR